MADVLAVGDKVETFGLLNGAYNDQRGVVKSPRTAQGRYGVRLHLADGDKTISLKAENLLRAIPPAPPSPGSSGGGGGAHVKHLTWSDAGAAVCAAHGAEVCGACGLDFALMNILAHMHAPGDTMEAQGVAWRRMEVETATYFAGPPPEQQTIPAGARPSQEVDDDAMACMTSLAAMQPGEGIDEAQSGGCVLTAGLLTYKSRFHPLGRTRLAGPDTCPLSQLNSSSCV